MAPDHKGLFSRGEKSFARTAAPDHQGIVNSEGLTMQANKVLWDDIDFVLLDLDGTLLDKYFDDFFWEEFIPEQYALLKGIPVEAAKAEIYAGYQQQTGKLAWTDIDYWSRRWGLDIPALKESVADRVAVHEGVFPFLEFVSSADKKVALLTNAHPKAVTVKLSRIPLRPFLDHIVCAHDVGYPKEEIGFWEAAQQRCGFDKTRSLFVDDHEVILIQARRFGIKHLLYKSHASSRIPRDDSKEFVSIRNFNEITPSP